MHIKHTVLHIINDAVFPLTCGIGLPPRPIEIRSVYGCEGDGQGGGRLVILGEESK